MKDHCITAYLFNIKKNRYVCCCECSHIDAILDGFLEDYDHFIIFFTSCFDPYIVGEIEASLLAQKE